MRFVAEKEYSGVTRASKGVTSQNQPLRFAAARRRIRNVNLSETPAGHLPPAHISAPEARRYAWENIWELS